MEQAKPRPSRASKAFILARHPAQGLLLLKAFKKRKGLHHQLPGGRVDEGDESAAAGAGKDEARFASFCSRGLDYSWVFIGC